VPRDTLTRAHALAPSAGLCHKGRVGRLRDFASMADFFSDREIDELQAAIDARRESSAARSDGPEADEAGPGVPETDARPPKMARRVQRGLV
jgi:hypothetical protein